MAELRVDADTVVVHLSGLERLVALRGDVEVGRAKVTAARVATDPWAELRGMRAPGVGIPGVVMFGTRRGRFGRDFVAISHRQPALVIELRDEPFARLIVSTPNPDSVAAALRPG